MRAPFEFAPSFSGATHAPSAARRFGREDVHCAFISSGTFIIVVIIIIQFIFIN